MSQTPTVKLKLHLKTNNGPGSPAPPPKPNANLASPSVTTPGVTKARIKLTTNSTPSTPAPVPGDDASKPKKTKAGRAPKPSARLIESKKRIKEESDDEEDSTIQVQPPPSKRLKLQLNRPSTSASGATPTLPLKTPVLPRLKATLRGKVPTRPPGEGYDSAASDVERDPVIEEQFILRMYPGEDCEYLRKAIADRKIGISKLQGGADVHMKFYQAEGRRGVVTICGRPYAATLVDLPCIIEGMKSWDKRGWWKSADICQMLWVFARVATEDDARTIPLPKMIDAETFQYPHGLTPPMHYARKRRFRKRISRTAIEAVEDAVEKLLAADAAVKSSRWEMMQPDQGRSRSYSESEQDYGEEEYSQDEDADAEGDLDDSAGYFGINHNNGNVQDMEDMDDLEADLEAAMQESMAATPISTTDATPVVMAETPAVEEEGEDSGDESVEGDEDEEGEAGGTIEVDEAERARQLERQGILEDIADLEKSLEGMHANLQTQTNPILRRRLDESIRKVKTELQLKKASIGEEDED